MPKSVTHTSFAAVLLLICAGGLLVGCDSSGGNGPPEPSFTLEFGSPLNESFSGAKAHQALFVGEEGQEGRYAQLFLAISGADTTALLLGFGRLQSTRLAPGTYDIVNSDKADTLETFDGFIGSYRSEQLASLGGSVDGSVEIKQQSNGTVRGSFSAEMEVRSPVPQGDSIVTVTGSYTARPDTAAVLEFLPIDEGVEIDSTDL